MCLDSSVGCSGTAGSLAACWDLVFFIGMGCGRTCLGKPLKNHAPERFQTWEGKKAGVGDMAANCQFLSLFP